MSNSCILWSISARRPQPVTEKQILRFLSENLELVKEEAKEYINEQIDKLTFKELQGVFEAGRQQYGGEFDVEAIPCVAELWKEACDTTLYVTFLQHQHEN